MGCFLSKLSCRKPSAYRSPVARAAKPTTASPAERATLSAPGPSTSSGSSLTEPMTLSLIEPVTISAVEPVPAGPSTPSHVEPVATIATKFPNELLLCITDFLELHDKFILSHTCKSFRNVTQRNWVSALGQLPRAEKLDFWSGLAFTLPNHWACGPCCRLHKIDKKDIPWVSSWEKQANWCQRDKGAAHLISGKSFKERHVQLALKFNRLNTVNQEYLGDIMQPFSEESFKDLYGRPAYKFRQVSPKIVAERFLLHTTQVYGDGAGISNRGFLRTTICPHLEAWSATRDGVTYLQCRCQQNACQCRRSLARLAPGDFHKDFNLALSHQGKEFTGHCSHCPTDYSILAKSGRITVSAWHDFGSFKSPEDKFWTVHIKSPQNGLTEGSVAHQIGLVVDQIGPVVHHDPGSIRNLYSMTPSIFNPKLVEVRDFGDRTQFWGGRISAKVARRPRAPTKTPAGEVSDEGFSCHRLL